MAPISARPIEARLDVLPDQDLLWGNVVRHVLGLEAVAYAQPLVSQKNRRDMYDTSPGYSRGTSAQSTVCLTARGSTVSEHEVTVPLIVRQERLIDEIAIRLRDEIGGEWSTVIVVHRNLSDRSDGRIDVYRPEGWVEYAQLPDAVFPLIDELRRVMYQPGKGVWFSARWTITKTGGDGGTMSARVSFNYDDEPMWPRPAHPGSYILDLEAFPRDEASLPDWLRQKVNDARRTL